MTGSASSPESTASIGSMDSGPLVSLASRNDDVETHVRSPAARLRPRLASKASSETNERAQGRPGAGRTHGPPAAKKAGGSHHRLGRTSGLPCATVLTLIARSPRGPGCLAPVASRIATARRSLSVGRPGPHAFAVRISAVRPHETSCASPKRPSHPRLTYRDDRAYAPLRTRRDGGKQPWICENRKRYIFRGRTGQPVRR